MNIFRENLQYNQQKYYIKDTNDRCICIGTSIWEDGGYKVSCYLISFKPTNLDSVEKCELWLEARLQWIMKQLQHSDKGEI